MGSKEFWNTVKRFLSSKGFMHNKNIDDKYIYKDKYITNENELTKTLIYQYSQKHYRKSANQNKKFY